MSHERGNPRKELGRNRKLGRGNKEKELKEDTKEKEKEKRTLKEIIGENGKSYKELPERGH